MKAQQVVCLLGVGHILLCVDAEVVFFLGPFGREPLGRAASKHLLVAPGDAWVAPAAMAVGWTLMVPPRRQ